MLSCSNSVVVSGPRWFTMWTATVLTLASVFLLERLVFKICYLSSQCPNVVTFGKKKKKSYQNIAFNYDNLCIKLKQILRLVKTRNLISMTV